MLVVSAFAGVTELLRHAAVLAAGGGANEATQDAGAVVREVEAIHREALADMTEGYTEVSEAVEGLLSEADRLADDVAIIHHGRILAGGTVEEVTGGEDMEKVFFDLVDAAEEEV